jgi:propanol-preferring alcohol dehydrogenase
VPVRKEVTTFPLEDANDALDAIRRGALRGSAVLVP